MSTAEHPDRRQRTRGGKGSPERGFIQRMRAREGITPDASADHSATRPAPRPAILTRQTHSSKCSLPGNVFAGGLYVRCTGCGSINRIQETP